MSQTRGASNEVPIVLAAFGSTIVATESIYREFEAAVRSRFSYCTIGRAITSRFVRNTLAARGDSVDGPEEALLKLRADGHAVAVLQSQHVTPGEEFGRLASLRVPGLSVIVGRPLIDSPSEVERLLEILAHEIRPGVPNVFVAHGNSRYPEYNRANLLLADGVRRRFRNCVLASLEGEPGPNALDTLSGEIASAGAVHFIPLLFVAGDHVLHDLMGNGPESWKSRLGGVEVTCGRPLGAIPAVIEILLDHLDEAVREARSLLDLSNY